MTRPGGTGLAPGAAASSRRRRRAILPVGPSGRSRTRQNELAHSHPNVTLHTRSRVTRLLTDSAGRAVTEIVVDHDGEQERYSADVVVVACGAINSAALLLASASDAHPDGLGNGSGVAGRHLMMHNNSSLIAFSKIPNPTKFQKTLGINDFYFGGDDWAFPLGAMQMLGKSEKVLIGFDAPEAEDPADLAMHAMDFWLTTEDLPLPDNRVTIDGDGQVSLRYQPTNLEAHQHLRGSPISWAVSSAGRMSWRTTPTAAAGWTSAASRTRTAPYGSVLIHAHPPWT
jgi:choline dehydrogenase-like flavoprotein